MTKPRVLLILQFCSECLNSDQISNTDVKHMYDIVYITHILVMTMAQDAHKNYVQNNSAPLVADEKCQVIECKYSPVYNF